MSNLGKYLSDYFVSTAEIRLDDEMYNYLMFWISKQEFANRTLRFVAGTKTNSRHVYCYYSDDEDEDGDHSESDDDGEEEEGDDDFDKYWAKAIRRDRYKKLRFTPAEGTHYFRYRGRFIAFSRHREENQRMNYELNPERLYLSCLGRDATAIRQLLAEAQRTFVERDGTKTIIYRGKNSGPDVDWVRCMARSPRPMSTVVLDQRQKDAFVDDVKEYLHPRTKRWYSDRGIPYRRGYLFYGPPGTGKTSLCVATSGLLGLKIYLLSLSGRSIDDDNLLSLFEDLPRRCIVLLEDVDSAGVAQSRSEETTSSSSSSSDPTSESDEKDETNNTDTKDKNKMAAAPIQRVSLSALLNVIDGVAASEGRILVMTTNHIEKLDPALLRPGRVDMTICFGYSDTESIKYLFCSIYGGSQLGKTKSAMNGVQKQQHHRQDPKLKLESNREDVNKLAAEFSSRVPSGEFTAAEIQGYLLKHKHKPHDAIEGAEEWIRGMREERSGKTR